MKDADKISSLLTRQEMELTNLNGLLCNELEILKNRDLSVLEQASADKEALLTKINQLDKEISHYTSLEQLKEEPTHSEQVTRIISLLHECKQQNEVNGQIINNSQIAINRFKNMLQKSISNNTMTYDSKGKTSISNKSIGIKA
ncbi:flagellar export chaperone FlgN [Colwellia sp. KU-HH00111]|uniref:flagella synthesis protein FlgN n=1 Tax=Colwellia sp. KU-HH00111 TaxID=3127652 RepID=UPI003101E4DF